MAYDPSLTVYENAKFLTVSLCYSHLERIDDLIVQNGMHQRYEDSRQFFERLDGRYRVAIFHARNVTTEKTRALLDVTLGKFFCFSKQADTISNYHDGYCCMKYFIVARRKLASPHNLTSSQRKFFDVT